MELKDTGHRGPLESMFQMRNAQWFGIIDKLALDAGEAS